MKLKELKVEVNKSELEEVVSPGDRKIIRLNEMMNLLSMKTHIDKLLEKAARDYESAFIIETDKMLEDSRGASVRPSMLSIENKFVVSIVLKDNSLIDLEGFRCMLEATEYADQIDYMLSSREGRKLLRQDLGRRAGGRA